MFILIENNRGKRPCFVATDHINTHTHTYTYSFQDIETVSWPILAQKKYKMYDTKADVAAGW